MITTPEPKNRAGILYRRMRRARTFVTVIMITYASVFLFLMIYGYSNHFKGMGSLFEMATTTNIVLAIAPIMVLPFGAIIFSLVQLRAFRKLMANGGKGPF